LDERLTIKFWKKVVFCVIAHMVLNSYTVESQSIIFQWSGENKR
jgi:hypothetical protein